MNPPQASGPGVIVKVGSTNVTVNFINGAEGIVRQTKPTHLKDDPGVDTVPKGKGKPVPID